jgi:hypothetical protein
MTAGTDPVTTIWMGSVVAGWDMMAPVAENSLSPDEVLARLSTCGSSSGRAALTAQSRCWCVSHDVEMTACNR